ncbi:PLP-dependent aminotransferase family protein [Deinococcus hopiensis]|uniref:MocR-like pyridoxine biosynthesis transcription factor PdxR n=1 Tax=Deinococcus hopiensis TaxID=309885 RepID=UPI0014828A4A|nr:PLP-dependent aminotransferase family protein [Deinococcus hopiensis]
MNSPDQPKYREVYARIRDSILTEQVRPGGRLASSRRLAEQLGVARATVEQAFDQLVLEGLIVRQTGRGTFVADRVPHLPRGVAPLSERPTHPAILSCRGTALLSAGVALGADVARGFAPCVPGRDTFPMHVWNKLAHSQARRHGRHLAGGGELGGLPELREAIAVHLGSSRGVRCAPEQVFILSSTQQALDVTARLLLDPGETVWIEDPGYLGARSALLAAGVQLVPVAVDEQGLQVQQGEHAAPHARLAFVTPSHQYPLGVTLSLARRKALLEWARRAGSWVFEDDYDSEFRYDGRPLAALQGLGPERVLYAGSFNKVLFPGVRLAYLVVPPALAGPLLAARQVMDGPPPSLTQATLAAFIASGAFTSHLHRLRGLYRERRDALLTAAQDLPEWAVLRPTDAGMHATLLFENGLDDVPLSYAAAAWALDVPPLSRYFLGQAPTQRGLVVGFGAMMPESIAQGMKVLGRVLGEAHLEVR